MLVSPNSKYNNNSFIFEIIIFIQMLSYVNSKLILKYDSIFIKYLLSANNKIIIIV
jgi:hypothetical protein